jgi:hypothetical protein
MFFIADLIVEQAIRSAIKKHLLHLVGILFPHINDDAWSNSLQLQNHSVISFLHGYLFPFVVLKRWGVTIHLLPLEIMLPVACINIIICWYVWVNHTLVAMATIVITLCVLSDVPVPTPWWPWEQLLVCFVYFVNCYYWGRLCALWYEVWSWRNSWVLSL